MIASHPHLLTDVDANHLAAEWLCQPASGFGRSQGLADLIGNADERRAQVPTLALVLAACEAHVAKDTWRRDGTTGWHGPYLSFLADHGYTGGRLISGSLTLSPAGHLPAHRRSLARRPRSAALRGRSRGARPVVLATTPQLGAPSQVLAPGVQLRGLVIHGVDPLQQRAVRGRLAPIGNGPAAGRREK